MTKKFSSSFGCFFGVVILAGLFALAASGSAQAGSITYKFSGDLVGVGTVTGQFTLNSGAVTAFDFMSPVATIDPSNGWFASVSLYTPAFSPNKDFVDLSFLDTDNDFLNLIFETPLSSFNGSNFFVSPVQPTSGSETQAGFQCSFRPQCGDSFEGVFSSGSATPLTATPEPSSLLLFGTSLLGLAPFRRKLLGQ